MQYNYSIVHCCAQPVLGFAYHIFIITLVSASAANIVQLFAALTLALLLHNAGTPPPKVLP
jgi:hypothetical protein